MSKSYDVNVELTLDFPLLDEQRELLSKQRDKARGHTRELLDGLLNLLCDIQEQSASEHGNEIVYGATCSECEEYFRSGSVVNGNVLCKKCASKEKKS